MNGKGRPTPSGRPPLFYQVTFSRQESCLFRSLGRGFGPTGTTTRRRLFLAIITTDIIIIGTTNCRRQYGQIKTRCFSFVRFRRAGLAGTRGAARRGGIVFGGYRHYRRWSRRNSLHFIPGLVIVDTFDDDLLGTAWAAAILTLFTRSLTFGADILLARGALLVIAVLTIVIPFPARILFAFSRRSNAREILAQAFIVSIIFQRLVIATEPGLVLFLTSPIISDDAEIMIRELEIIFGVHTVAGELRITRQIAIFFQQLGRIATGAVVNPVAVFAAPIATVLATIVPATIAATGLTIIDQWWILAFNAILNALHPAGV